MPASLPWFERVPNIPPAKIGTVPGLVQVHGGDLRRIERGKTVRVGESEGDPWTRVTVDRTDPMTGWFQADR